MKKLTSSIRRFFATRKTNETGIVKGSNRKVTPWAQRSEKQHSVMWLIENAVTEEMLTEVLKFANYQTESAPDTRRRWAEAAEKRLFVLKRRPPMYGKVEFEEFRLEFNRTFDGGPGGLIPPGGGFKELRQAELMALPESSMNKPGKDFLAIEPGGPRQAEMSEEIRVLIEAAEVPRYVDPAFRLAMIEKGQMAVYSDGKRYCHDASKTVTEMRIMARRSNCPPPQTLGVDQHQPAREECLYNEWDVLFFSADRDITREVVSETHPDAMRQSRVSPGCALFFGTHHDGIVPAHWKFQMEKLFGITIRYESLVIAGTSNVPAKPDPLADLKAVIADLNAPPSPAK